ncbi:MAG: outer membrane protein assembly factor BamA [Mariprofundaceae bacterium]|nr:outer membrane protein assembly factor BamA [Mariprofundaceae bacterium]
MKIIVFCFLSILFTSSVQANEQDVYVSDIQVRGNQFVETDHILANLVSQKAKDINNNHIAKDIRRLMKTGFYQDVRVLYENGVLIFKVIENPMIASLDFEGNDEILTKKLTPLLSLKPGRILSMAAMQKDETRLRKEYLKKGFYQVDIKVTPKKLSDGRVALTFYIEEGDVTRIKRIRFIGNNAFSDQDLQGVTMSRAADFVAWFGDRDIFDSERLKADAQVLMKWYLDHGYLDAQVESTIASLSADKRWFYINFNIHEGPIYKVRKLSLSGDIVPDRKTLKSKILLEYGETYSLTALQSTLSAMTEAVGNEGFAFANVTPEFHRDLNTNTVDIRFNVEKNREIYIRRIFITGNSKTEDEVVRRELRQHEASRYDASKYNMSKKRLNRKDFFEKVRFSFKETNEQSQVDLEVAVEEKKTGSFSIGAGYSQLEKTFFTGKLEERNFLGKGLGANLNASIGGTTQNFNLSITEPYFLGEELSLTTNVFKTQSNLQTITQYTQNNTGGGLTLGVPLTEEMSYSIGYQYTGTNLTNIPVNASLLLLSQAGINVTGEVSQAIGWDNRDKVLASTSGSTHSLSVNIAGIGGDNYFTEFSVASKWYTQLAPRYILNPQVSLRQISGYKKKNVPIYRRYSIGGMGSLRGFDNFGVSILDPVTGDIIGGNQMMKASLNLFVPLPYVKTGGFRGVFFLDAGTVADKTNSLQWRTMRASYGFAIEWLSPIGPVGLIWGYPIRQQPGDRLKAFEFALGSGF